MTTPRYRDDIKGNVKAHIADCEQSMRNQITHSEDFILTAEDCPAWAEYQDTLTAAEMRAAFKRAQRQTA